MNLLECVRLIRADSGMQPVIRATVTDEEWEMPSVHPEWQHRILF